jgi:hypothetical protein
MDAFKINVKFFAASDSTFESSQIVPTFHLWIQMHSVPDHSLIDVADYAHVQNGPGVVLVASEANFYLDQVGGRLGLTYSRKKPIDGTFADRLTQAIAAAIDACARLEDDGTVNDRIKFITNEAMIQINDRLLAPNTPATFESTKSDIQTVAKRLFGGNNVTLEHKSDPGKLFTVSIKTSSPATIADLASRLATAPVR